ncbi:hypothetical protein OHA98_40020 [Streptomyces sp. NBC_00654]|nr:hypothetical protein [Streptomyces sp. NBC_00654]MCX4970831.1 hypothetical protein [Streptomyces sp. NBC_00654]
MELVAGVIRETVTCDGAECTPDDHHRFVTENMRIAVERTKTT